MPKSRHRKIKKNVARLQRKQAFEVSAKIADYAGRLTNQQQLDTCLMQEKDTERRRRLFDFMKPFLKFPNPEFPSIIERPRIFAP
jgi:hypothetical protein